MDDIIVRFIRLPLSVKGFVLDSPDGYHNIYINDRLSSGLQREVYRHELRHIRKGHLNSTLPVSLCEQDADGWM